MVKCFQWRDIWGQAWIKTRRKSCTYLKTALSRQKWQDIGLGEGFLYLRIAWRERNVSEAEWVRTGNQKATWSHSNANLGFKYIFRCLPRAESSNFWIFLMFSSVQISHSVVSDCFSPMNCSTPGLPAHHQHPEFAQTHVHWVGDAI